MAVYRMVKGCKGCEIGSGKQKDHNHFILDSEEYERCKIRMIVIGFILAIVMCIMIWLRGS